MFIHSEVVAATYYFRKLRIYFKHERAYFNTPGNQREFGQPVSYYFEWRK